MQSVLSSAFHLSAWECCSPTYPNIKSTEYIIIPEYPIPNQANVLHHSYNLKLYLHLHEYLSEHIFQQFEAIKSANSFQGAAHDDNLRF